MSFPGYERYKDSGVEWLGEVPEHWTVKRLGHFISERRTKVSDEDYQPLSVTKNGIVPRLETAAKTDDGDNRKLVGKGDFVINGRSDRKGSSGLSPYVGSVSLINIVLELVGLNGGFAHHMFRSAPFQEEFYRYGKGIVADLWSTGFTEMKNIVVAVPDNSEQVRIADFLDEVTRRIDALVDEQERLIALLKEKRQAMISHAVTNGLNSHVSTKQSGIAWIGLLPKHWRVGKSMRHVRILSGFAFPSAAFSDDENDVKLLRGINVGVGCIRWDEVVYWKRAPNDGLSEFELREGDLLLGMDRPIIKDGVRVAVVGARDLPCLLLQRVARLRTDSQLDSRYFGCLLSSQMFAAHFSPETSGVSVPHISPEQIGSFVIPLPGIDEQGAIVSYIARVTSKCDTLMAEARYAIQLLQERRAALISAAVTGKIDTRSYTPRLTLSPKAMHESA